MSSTLPDAPLIALTMIAQATSLSVLSNGKGASQIAVAVVEQHQNGHGGRDQRVIRLIHLASDYHHPQLYGLFNSVTFS